MSKSLKTVHLKMYPSSDYMPSPRLNPGYVGMLTCIIMIKYCTTATQISELQHRSMTSISPT